MASKTIIDGIDVQDCHEWYSLPDSKLYCKISNEGDFTCKSNPNCYFKQLERTKQEVKKWKHQAELGSDTTDRLSKQLEQKEQECQELQERVASIIYNLTGGRLSYSTYTLEACAEAYSDQLKIDVERATKELEEENEELKKQLEKYQDQELTIVNTIGNLQLQVKAWIEQSQKYKQALEDIKKYCTYMNTFNEYNKTNMGLKVDVVLDLINKAKEQ